ncbi:unnamed protein product, partial [Porites evermanni]
LQFGLRRLPLDITSLETLLAKCVKTQTYRASSAITQHVDWKKGISDKLIMERTGHRDIRSLQRYQRPDISKVLNCRSEGSVGEREAESSLKREVDQLVDDEVKRFCQDDNNATVNGS